MKTRSQGPATPLPDVTVNKKRRLNKPAELPLMTRYGLVWPKFDYHRAVKLYMPNTQSWDDLAHQVIIIAEGNVFIVPHGYGCVVFTALCSTGFVIWTWYKQIQAKSVFRQRDLFIYSPGAEIYNGIYRAYRSTLELHSRFLFHLIFSGLEWPMMSTVAGMSWILARFFYVKAYLRGEPVERYYHWGENVFFNALRIGALYHGFKTLFKNA